MKNYYEVATTTIVTFLNDLYRKVFLNALFSITEFCFAYEQLYSVTQTTGQWSSVAHRVYLNAAYKYLAFCFAISGGNQLRIRRDLKTIELTHRLIGAY